MESHNHQLRSKELEEKTTICAFCIADFWDIREGRRESSALNDRVDTTHTKIVPNSVEIRSYARIR